MGNSVRFTANPLWLASYGVTRLVLTGGWKRYTFWQCTAIGRLAGSTRLVDLNVSNGSLAQLHAMTSVRLRRSGRSVPSMTSMTLTYITRVDTKRVDVISSRSNLHLWLRVARMDGSGIPVGY